MAVALAPYQAPDSEILETFSRLDFVTSSEVVLPVLRQACKAACVSDVTILLEGETGTGKGVLAAAIHRLDPKRKSFPLITVNCGTITETLAETELFGHSRGAFSGAVADRRGLFQAAKYGTLFLDDVNALSHPLQSKLLDVVQRRTLRPVGSDYETSVDVRIIAASNQPLESLVRNGHFRSDLYHRLNVVRLFLPPLRNRAADLEQLILAFARRHRQLYEPIEYVEPELLALLKLESFQGNVRELENAVQRMLFLKTGGTSFGVIDWMAQSNKEHAETDPDPLAQAAEAIWKAISQRGIPYAQACQEIERLVLKAAMSLSGFTRRSIAKQLCTSERTLYYKMRTHGLGKARG